MGATSYKTGVLPYTLFRGRLSTFFPDERPSRPVGVFGAGGGIRTGKPPTVDMSVGGSNLLTADGMRRGLRNGILSIIFPLKREGGKLNINRAEK